MAISSQLTVIKPRTIQLVPAGTVVAAAGTLTGGVDAAALNWIARGLDNYAIAEAILRITAAATAAGDTLDAFLDTTFDGGTTWVNVGHFTQALGNGGAKTLALQIPLVVAAAAADRSADLAAANAFGLIGSQLRARTTAAQASAVSFTFGIAVKLLPA